MHDPDTQAFVIPWRYRWSTLGAKPWRYWVPLITIWHHDPEKDGTDDSCGWFAPKATEEVRSIVKSLAGDEGRHPWFMALCAKSNEDPITCECLLRGAFLLMSRCLVNRGVLRKRQAVTVDEATKWASELTHNSIDNFRSSLCFLAGYHSNFEEDREADRERQAEGFFYAIARYIRRERRPWYRHPKWHIHHWHLQIHPLQHFKRWAFSRCCKCGGRFAWGASVGTNSWNSKGPSWFGEKDVYHMDCDRPQFPDAAGEARGARG